MRKVSYLLAAAIGVALCGGAQAATSMWLSQDAAGTPIAGDTINVAPGATLQLYCFLESDQVGNTYELMVGYDRSDAPTYGTGKDTNDGEFGKLALLSTKAAIEASMPLSFTVLRSAVLDASGREEANSYIDGRPYGFVGRAATYANAAPGEVLCFSFQLRNNMVAPGDFQYVVVSDQAGGNSYSSAWKYGTSLREDSYALKVVNGASLPAVGANNRAVLDAIMSTAAPNYIWVLWGKVGDVTPDGFNIDDGSGVVINVSASGHGLTGGEYVAVRGTLDVGTKTVTSQEITRYK